MTRRENEKHVLDMMVRMYCLRKEGNKTMCPRCAELLEYANHRLDICRFADEKPTCRVCPVHCYRAEMKNRMKEVMRWAGPRMILYHPIVAIKHLIREL